MPEKTGWTGTQIGVLVILLVLTNAVTGAVVFFAVPQAEPEPPVLVTTIKVTAPWAASELDRFQPVMDAFTQETGIEIDYLTFRQEDLVPLLPASFDIMQTPADVMLGIPSGVIKTFGAGGHLVDMTAVNGASDVSSDLFQLVSDGTREWGGTYTGKAWVGYWYRASFFQGTGMDPATITSYAEFTTLLEGVSAMPGVTNPIISGDGVGWPLTGIVEDFILKFGGADMHRQLAAGTLAWNDPSVQAIFRDRLVPWLQAGHFSAPIDFPRPSYDEWWNGTYAFYMMGSWITADIPGLITGADQSDMRVVAMPAASGVSAGVNFPADYFMVSTYARNVTAAMEFAAYLMSNAGQTIQVGQGGHLATATGVATSAYPAGLDRNIAEGLAGNTLVNDLDDTRGQPFQGVMWSELQALWNAPATWMTVLDNIEAAA